MSILNLDGDDVIGTSFGPVILPESELRFSSCCCSQLYNFTLMGQLEWVNVKLFWPPEILYLTVTVRAVLVTLPHALVPDLFLPHPCQDYGRSSPFSSSSSCHFPLMDLSVFCFLIAQLPQIFKKLQFYYFAFIYKDDSSDSCLFIFYRIFFYVL